MLKKLTALVLTLLLCVAFVGCGDNANTPKDNDTNNEESTPFINDILSNATVGSTITFGKYNIDKSTEEKEDLEWLVLDKQDGKLFVISKYVVETGNYYDDLPWEKSKLRSWLHNDFTPAAFSSEESEKILNTRVENTGYEGDIIFEKRYDPTDDKVYIPSFSELKKYGLSTESFAADDESRIAYTFDGQACSWLLRNTTSKANGFCRLTKTGVYYFSSANYGDTGIRPVMWLSYN